MWRDPALEAFFQSAVPHYDRSGGLAALLDELFPIKRGRVSLDLASYELRDSEAGIVLLLVLRMVLWTEASAIEDIVEQATPILVLPRQTADGGFEHDGVPIVVDAAAVIDRVRRYVDGLGQALVLRWEPWLASEDREPYALLPRMA